MVDFTFPELNADTGTATADGLRNVANTAANFACSAWQNYAGATVGLPDPTGFGSFMNGVYSRLCSPRGSTPPAPTTPFTGGQCPKLYDVNGTFQYKGSTSLPFGVRLLGPISGAGTQAGSGTRIRYGIQGAPNPSGGNPTGFASLVEGEPQNINPVTINISSVVPVSGPDNCGNPPPAYPFNTPPSSVVNNNTTVNIGGGLAIAVPIALVPVFVDANVNIKPTINVNVGPFKVTFDAGGVTIAPSFNFNTGTTVNPAPQFDPRSPVPTPDQQPKLPNAPCQNPALPVDLTEIKNKLTVIDTTTKDTKLCSCPGKYQLVTTALGNANSGVATLPANCRKVRFAVGTLEANAQTIYGGGTAQDVVFAGWASFSTASGEGGDRIALQYQTTTLDVPLGSTTVSWTIKGAMVAAVSAISAVPDDTNYEPGILQFKRKPT